MTLILVNHKGGLNDENLVAVRGKNEIKRTR